MSRKARKTLPLRPIPLGRWTTKERIITVAEVLHREQGVRAPHWASQLHQKDELLSAVALKSQPPGMEPDKSVLEVLPRAQCLKSMRWSADWSYSCRCSKHPICLLEVLSPLFTPVRCSKAAGSQGFLQSKELCLTYLLLALCLISLKVVDALVKIPFVSVTFFLYYFRNPLSMGFSRQEY